MINWSYSIFCWSIQTRFFTLNGAGRYVVLVSLQEPRYIRHSSPNLNHKIAELCRERGGGRTIDAAALTPPDAKNLNKSRRPRGEECLRRNCIRSPAPTLCMRCVQLSQAVADTAGSWSLHIWRPHTPHWRGKRGAKNMYTKFAVKQYMCCVQRMGHGSLEPTLG